VRPWYTNVPATCSAPLPASPFRRRRQDYAALRAREEPLAPACLPVPALSLQRGVDTARWNAGTAGLARASTTFTGTVLACCEHAQTVPSRVRSYCGRVAATCSMLRVIAVLLGYWERRCCMLGAEAVCACAV